MKASSLAKLIFPILIIATVVVVIVMFNGTDSVDLGERKTVAETSIGTDGGSISVDDPELEGFEMSIPEGAYDEEVDFKISVAEIKSHEHGDAFQPITPLITIENDRKKADKPLALSIPITIDSETEFAMAFYMDIETGKLEAIPSVDLKNDGIDILTTHFSSVVVSKITVEELERAYLSSGTSVDSGFVPGTDDWSFVNYGSVIAPYGHCAGQAITMGWYYTEQKVALGEESLFTRFDNNDLEATPDFWEDDSLGYRFASVIQATIDWEAESFHEFLDYSSTYNDAKIKQSFAYAMLMTGEPQFMGIYEKDMDGNRTSGHAILAYKVTQHRIYVADPNYPGQDDRFVEIDGNHFKDYSSGANAEDISTHGAIAYNDFVFIGTWALVDRDTIEDRYEEVEDQTIGTDLMPTLTLEYLSVYNADDIDDHTWELLDRQLVLNQDEHNPNMPAALKDTVLLSVSTGYSDVAIFLYRDNQLVDGPYLPDDDGYVYFEAALEQGDNTFGVLAMHDDGSDYRYSDFKRLRVHYTSETNTDDDSVVCFLDNEPPYPQFDGNFWGTYRFESHANDNPEPKYAYLTFYSMDENPDHPTNYLFFEYETQDGYKSELEGRWQIVLHETYHVLEFRDPDRSFLHASYRLSDDYTYLYQLDEDGETQSTYVKIFCE